MTKPPTFKTENIGFLAYLIAILIALAAIGMIVGPHIH